MLLLMIKCEILIEITCEADSQSIRCLRADCILRFKLVLRKKVKYLAAVPEGHGTSKPYSKGRVKAKGMVHRSQMQQMILQY